MLDSLSYCHLSDVIEGHHDCLMVCDSLCVYVLSYCSLLSYDDCPLIVITYVIIISWGIVL